MQEKYDLCVVPGLRFGEDWSLRKGLQQRLDKVVGLYQDGQIGKIIVSGKWTIWYDWMHIKPPVTEAMLMKRYLQKQGVPKTNIVCENRSKDTVGNAYYAKVLARKYPAVRRILVVCTSEREQRLRYLFQKFFGNDYFVSFYAITARHDAKSSLGNEERLLEEDKKLLERMRDGHEEDIKRRLYSLPYYRKQAIAIENHSSKGFPELGRARAR